MPTSVGPNTFGEENLVFGYDLADVSNSYRGEPTVNLISGGSNWANGVGGTAGERNFASIVVEVTDNHYYSAERPHVVRLVCTATGSSGYKEFAQQSTGNTSGSSYVYSFDYKFIIPNDSSDGAMGTPFVYGDGYKTPDSSVYQAATSQTDTPLKDGWIRRSFKYDATYTGNNYYRTNIHSNGYYYEVLLDNFQIEEKSHATPFTAGTRSATQGLVDLTGNSTLNLTNVSFDSNAQMTFDGTDDLLDTNLFSGRNPSTDPFTVEAVLKADTTSGARLWIDASGNGVNQRFYSSLDDGGGNPLGISGSAYGDSAPNTTDWTHQTIVMDGTTARSYRNGVATYTKEYGSYTLSGDIIIGGRNGYNWSGDIALVKVYNRALTASEIKSNYNATKGRFNI